MMMIDIRDNDNGCMVLWFIASSPETNNRDEKTARRNEPKANFGNFKK
jgi:hypothetical protein